MLLINFQEALRNSFAKVDTMQNLSSETFSSLLMSFLVTLAMPSPAFGISVG
jgi:hypothetical protein